MKAHLAKVSLALLSAAFLLGCQDLGSEPVGPEGLGVQANKTGEDHTHGKGGDDGGGKVEATIVSVTVSGGMQATQQDMEFRVKKDILRLAARPPVELKIAMTKTHEATIAACVQTGSGAPNDALAATLFDKLMLGAIDPTNAVFALIDTTALNGSSEDHRINIFAEDIKVLDAPTVTVEDGITGDFTATFSGGNIELTGIPTGGNFGSHVHLTCPIQTGDAITFDVVRQ